MVTIMLISTHIVSVDLVESADPRLKPDINPMPFDAKRLIYGGFETIVDI